LLYAGTYLAIKIKKNNNMKSFIAFLGLLFLSGAVYAQLAVRPYFGVNSTTLTKDYSNAQWQSELGYQGGVDLQIGNKIYFQSGLQWEMLNSSLRPTNPSIGDLTEFRSTHLRIPLLLGIRLFDASTKDLFNIRVFTGPDASFLIGSNGAVFNNVRFNRDALKNTSFGYNLGVGLDVLIFFADAGYRWGLTRFFDETLINNGSRANVFYANAGIRFRL
jgi:hypothetical protein